MSTEAEISHAQQVALALPRPHLRPPMFARALIALVRLYQQMISPWLGARLPLRAVVLAVCGRVSREPRRRPRQLAFAETPV